MTREHGPIDTLLAELAPRWKALGEDPASGIADTKENVAQLLERLEAHLLLEETFIFPQLSRLLSPEEHQAIQREMDARRSVRF